MARRVKLPVCSPAFILDVHGPTGVPGFVPGLFQDRAAYRLNKSSIWAAIPAFDCEGLYPAILKW